LAPAASDSAFLPQHVLQNAQQQIFLQMGVLHIAWQLALQPAMHPQKDTPQQPKQQQSQQQLDIVRNSFHFPITLPFPGPF